MPLFMFPKTSDVVNKAAIVVAKFGSAVAILWYATF
jgi:hypothetical protein